MGNPILENTINKKKSDAFEKTLLRSVVTSI